MISEELFEELHEAWLTCPQRDPFDDDQWIAGYGTIGNIKKNVTLTIRFWMEYFDDDYINAIDEELKDKIYHYKMRLRVAENNIIQQVFG